MVPGLRGYHADVGGFLSRPRGGDWLDDEVESWRAAGVECVVSGLTPAEAEELDLAQEEAACEGYGAPIRRVELGGA